MSKNLNPYQDNPTPDYSRRNLSGDLEAQKSTIIQILTEGYSRNVLDIEEFERRVEIAEKAENSAALALLISDLPDFARGSSSQASPYYPGEEEEKHLGIMSSRTMNGHWLKSRRNVLYSLMSSQNFDFRDVEMPADVVEIRVFALMSEVNLIIPPGVTVDLDVLPVMSECKEDKKIRQSTRESSGPRIRLTGTVFMSSVRIRQKQ